ncbi:MAG: AraC family transcriptional regulator [Bacteroidota bacterium]
MELIVHQNIADLYRALNLPIAQDLDFTIHFLPDIHRELPFRSPIFRAEYFSFVFVKTGRGTYTIDNHQFPFEAHTIYFTNPGHIKGFAIEEMENAYIITLTEAFLRENVHPDIFEEFPFLLAETVPPKVLSEAAFANFEDLYLQIFKEFKQTSRFKNKILGNLFVVLLLKIKAQFWQAYNPLEEGDRSSQIVKSFKYLLEKQFTDMDALSNEQLFQVQDYARQLQLHPNYLTHVIKSKTGKTVNQWISQRMISTAKSLLKNTQLSAKEIAFRLGFNQATHFNRFFKKHTAMTPLSFRKTQ